MGIEVTRADRVARITINRPEKRNAMSFTMWQQLEEQLAAIAGSDVVAVVLTGSGGAFCAGMDLEEMRSSDRSSVSRLQTLGLRTVAALQDLPQPKVAEVDGPCLGAGFSLALACDVRFASPRSRFGIPALRNGLVYDPALTGRVVDIVRTGPAALLILGGQQWDGPEALRHGLVDHCADDVAGPVASFLSSLASASATDVMASVAALRRAPRPVQPPSVAVGG